MVCFSVCVCACALTGSLCDHQALLWARGQCVGCCEASLSRLEKERVGWRRRRPAVCWAPSQLFLMDPVEELTALKRACLLSLIVKSKTESPLCCFCHFVTAGTLNEQLSLSYFLFNLCLVHTQIRLGFYTCSSCRERNLCSEQQHKLFTVKDDHILFLHDNNLITWCCCFI